MQNKTLISWSQTQGMVLEIARQLTNDQWKPDIIVGITRGGAVPAVLLSQYLSVPMVPLAVSLRDHPTTTSACDLAETALGYVPLEQREHAARCEQSDLFKKNILIVDDINDSGATVRWIKNDWRRSCLPAHPKWNSVWDKNVRFAALVNNLSSSEHINYSAMSVDKFYEDVWIEFAWENFWQK